MNAPAPRKWSSKLMFFAAAIGSAVGISNIWKFTYVAGENGGGAFVLVYVLAIALIAFPALAAEFLLGRRGAASVPKTMERLAEQDGIYYRLLAVCGAFLALGFYSVVAGWTIDYFVLALAGGFAESTPESAAVGLETMLGSPGRMMASQFAFISLTAVIVAAGVRGGLERALRWMTPALFALLLVLLLYASMAGDMASAVRFLFMPNFDALDAHTVLMAVGQAFFSLGIGLGVLMTVAAYMDERSSILKAAVVVAAADGLVALLAGLAIFPLVFAYGLSPAEGPGLIFATLPVAFGQVPGGAVIAPLFFLLMAFAALTSAITILETIVAWVEDTTRLGRRRITMLCAGLLWITGLATVFSFNLWADFRPVPFVPALAERTVFGVLDYLVSNLMMPLGGVMVAVIAGWSLPRAASKAELGSVPEGLFTAWRFAVRYLVPVAILVLFIMNLGG
jgi:neurotransmitter:Na+ symporter, NSS family